jgi:hypothetical protein
VDRTEAAIRRTFTRANASEIIEAINATLCYIYA